MVKRAGLALLVLGLSALAVFGGRLALLFVTMLVAAVAARELYRSLRAPGVRPPVTVGDVSIVALLVVGYARGGRAPAAFPFVIAAALFLSFVVLLVRRDRAKATRATAATLFPVLTVGLPAAYVVSMRSHGGGYRLAWVFVVTASACEFGAVTVTWAFRRRALTPRARRTWEHLAGALFGAVVAGLIAVAGASPPFTWARAFILGALVAVVLTMGDLVWATIEDDLARSEPLVKRPRAIVLPRIGGALLSAPVFFYVFRALVS